MRVSEMWVWLPMEGGRYASHVTHTPPLSRHACSKHAQHHAQAVAAYASLMQGLAGEPILILVGSDGGNAMSVAKKLAGEAKQRGLVPRYARVIGGQVRGRRVGKD